MAFGKKPQTGLDESKLDQFLSGAKDAVSMQPGTTPEQPVRPDPAANLSFADLMPPEEKIKKFPLAIPPALHRELTAIAKTADKPLHEYILRTLAEKVMQEKAGKR